MNSVRSPLFDKLHEGLEEGAVGLMRAYVDNFLACQNLYGDETLRKGRLASHSRESDLLRQVKVSTVLNDLSFLNLEGGSDFHMTWLTPAGHSLLLGSNEISVAVTTEQLNKIGNQGISLCFCLRNDERSFFKDLGPLIAGGHLLVEPQKMIGYVLRQNEDGSRHFEMLDVEPNSSPHQWIVQTKQTADQIISMETSQGVQSDDNVLANVLMPFIEGTSTGDLAMILEDEFDILAEFRSSIRELVIEAKRKNPDVSSILHDVVNPKVAKLQRRFEHITNMSKLKVGGAALATASLALTSFLSGGIVAGIGAIAGASGALMVAKEYASGANDLQALKDDPTYLLWKLDGVRRLTS